MIARRPVRPAVSAAVANLALPCAIESMESRRLFAAPALDAVANYNVPIGKTIQIPVTAASTTGAVTYSVRSGNKAAVNGSYHTGNTFIQMNVAGYSEPMVFELFNDVAPDTVRRITGLVNAGYYNGLTFHRIINDFVIQGGDPKGDGSGGPASGSFDDEFNAGTTFTGTGQLAMANSGKDTNGSQFFITEGPQRLLDFNHTIFGQLVRGEATRQAISNTATDTNGTPTATQTITSVKVIRDTTDAVLVLKGMIAGAYTVKVTATNADGSTSRNFTVNVAADTINDPPILNKLQPVYYTSVNTPISIDLGSTDAEGTPGAFGAQFINANGATGAFGTTDDSIVTFTPAKGFSGVFTVLVGVVGSTADQSRGSTPLDQNAPLGGIADSQVITVAVGDQPISASGYSFDATAGAPVTNVPVATFRDTTTTSLASEFTAKIEWGDGTVTDGAIGKSKNGRFAVYGTKTYAAAASGAEPLTVTITGKGGAKAVATGTATVRDYASVANGILSVFGSSFADRIGIGRKTTNYVVTVNGKTKAFPFGSVTSIQAYGYDGNDVILLADTVAVGTYLDGGLGNDAITGGSGDDVINGAAGRDTINTGIGNNRVAGGDDADTITGGTGRDRLFGGAGNDSISGGPGRDILSGDEGNDTLLGAASADTLYGGAGDDVLNGLGGADVIYGGAGVNSVKADVLDTYPDKDVVVV